MKEEAIKFISEIVKPWEILNIKFSTALSMNPAINDFITSANALTISIKHLPEALIQAKPYNLALENRSYEILHDLADSIKHGANNLRNQGRRSTIDVSTMFERNHDATVRFLRNRIVIMHNTYGKIDFMECTMEASKFIAEKLDVRTNWNPQIIIKSGDFSNEIYIHASVENQVHWQAMKLEFVEFEPDGGYKNVDLNGQVLFQLTIDDQLSIG
ncbi:hypothetical protein [Flavobacterium humidisoli]|uniref:Uncharacterized protein n=1 Tax=Flavobacterium humidisoli TaxID=2937442 RepID=A0ABY4LQI4_9FLAO|nr:hypothetical protein [Flavobacterium humidisoli]UPZ14518.1 hypothetical protein M0M44_17320 [Flavobacterium humidisoli]